jgi:hypothetical protein
LILEPVSGSPFVRALADELSNGHDATFCASLIECFAKSRPRSRSKLRFDSLVGDEMMEREDAASLASGEQASRFSDHLRATPAR